MARRPGVLTDADIRRLIGSNSGSRRPDNPNIGPVGESSVPGFDSPQTDKLMNRPVDPATGMQAPLTTGNIGQALKELASGSLAQYGLTERDIRRLYRGVNRNLRSLSDPYLMNMVKGMLGQGLNMRQILRDPAFLDYKENYRGLRETGQENMATDLSWVEKFRNVSRDNFNALLLQNSMGVPAASSGGGGGGSGGGGGGHGGGGGYSRHYGGGGSGGGDGKVTSDFDVSQSGSRNIDMWWPHVNQIIQASANIHNDKQLRNFIAGVRATLGTDEVGLQKILDANNANSTPKEKAAAIALWNKSGGETGGPNEYLDSLNDLTTETAAAGLTAKGELNALQTKEAQAQRAYNPSSVIPGMSNELPPEVQRAIYNRLAPKNQAQVAPELTAGYDPISRGLIQSQFPVDPKLIAKERSGDITEEEAAELKSQRDAQEHKLNPYSPEELAKFDRGGGAIPSAPTDLFSALGLKGGVGIPYTNVTTGNTPKSMLFRQFTGKENAKQREIYRNAIAAREVAKQATLARNLSGNWGAAESKRSLKEDFDIDWQMPDVPLPPGGKIPGRMEGPGPQPYGVPDVLGGGDKTGGRRKHAAKVTPGGNAVVRAAVQNATPPTDTGTGPGLGRVLGLTPSGPVVNPTRQQVAQWNPGTTPTVTPTPSRRGSTYGRNRDSGASWNYNKQSEITNPFSPEKPSSLRSLAQRSPYLNEPAAPGESKIYGGAGGTPISATTPDYSQGYEGIVTSALQKIARDKAISDAAHAAALRRTNELGYRPAYGPGTSEAVSSGLQRGYEAGAASVSANNPGISTADAVARAIRSARTPQKSYRGPSSGGLPTFRS